MFQFSKSFCYLFALLLVAFWQNENGCCFKHAIYDEHYREHRQDKIVSIYVGASTTTSDDIR